MIRHLLLAKLKDGVGADDPRAASAAEALAALGGLLSEAARPASWETHHGVGKRPISAQLVLVCDFPDEAALEAYQADPAHRKVAQQLREVFDLSSGDYVH